MDENRENTTAYEPNFVLQDTPQDQSSDQGAYRDPRENFARSKNRDFTATLNEDLGDIDYTSTDFYGTGNTQNNYYHDDFAQEAESTFYTNGYNDGEPPLSNKPKKKSRKSQSVTLTRRTLTLLIILMMLASVVFGAGSGLLTHALLDSDNSPISTGSVETNGAYTLEDATSASMSIAEITEKTQKSVVEIRTESVASDSWMRQYVTEGAGSGVIISNDGYIMTNNHVIDGARKITVTTIDEKEYSATLVGTDELNDVAVLKIDATDLNAATYGNSDQLQVGDLAVAIGNPLGELGGTVTSGIISSLDRELSIDGKSMTLLQTDASINPGNSGGGLFNDDGQLIGLVVAKSSGSDVEGLGFAIPINTAAKVAEQLMTQGYVSGQVSTGMSYQEGSTGNSYGYDSNDMFGGFFQDNSQQSQSTAVYIAEVNGENAKAAGFKAGDMVYAVDEQVITSFDELSSIITQKKVGDTVKYTIVRDNQVMNIKLELEEKTHE